NGVRLVGRSLKYHRPRGIVSAGPEEPCALVRVEKDGVGGPNRRATEIVLEDGLYAASQHCWPNLRFDLGSLADRFAPLLPAGVYYKTFKTGWARLWEPLLRRMAGLGPAPSLPQSGAPEPARCDKTHAHCDVL